MFWHLRDRETGEQVALQELRDETVHIKIEDTAFALGNAGKPREASAECERMIALHPTEALHHSELAMVLLRAGAGEAARREARKAVAMAPSDASALVVLGYVLSFDTLGRPYTYDWDRAGAIAALEKARKLDPKHLGHPTPVISWLRLAPLRKPPAAWIAACAPPLQAIAGRRPAVHRARHLCGGDRPAAQDARVLGCAARERVSRQQPVDLAGAAANLGIALVRRHPRQGRRPTDRNCSRLVSL